MPKKPIIIIPVLCVIPLVLGYFLGIKDEERLSNGDTETDLKKEPEFLKEGLVAYYPFNGNAKDESGNNHHATVNGGATLTADRFGSASKAYSFDGIDDSIDSNDAINIPLDLFTYSIWVQPDNFQEGETWETFVSRAVVPEDKKNLNWFGMPHHENPRSLRLHTSRTGWLDSTQGVVAFNQWSHFIGTYDGTTAKIYLNGQLVAEGTTSPAPPSTSYKFYIGRNYSINPEFLSGLVDDVRIYNRALSAEEVKALYEFEKAE